MVSNDESSPLYITITKSPSEPSAYLNTLKMFAGGCEKFRNCVRERFRDDTIPKTGHGGPYQRTPNQSTPTYQRVTVPVVDLHRANLLLRSGGVFVCALWLTEDHDEEDHNDEEEEEDYLLGFQFLVFLVAFLLYPLHMNPYM
ncbi:hypothetical protein ABEB36_013047 [Hypothenemus hampei]|uniref:Uncharacterized protein n=1 Tax=Hypothenemus hampei TaxID=57062 RepID=A0ABD1E6Z2_HYPHA